MAATVHGTDQALALIDGGSGIDTGAELAAGYAARRGVWVNVTGTYRIWGELGTYKDRYMVAGSGAGIINTKITDDGGNALDDGAIIAEL